MKPFFSDRRRSREEAHVDDWLMTYADMITLLLCFFAVFIAISVPEQEKFENAKEKVVQTFAGATSDNMKGQYALPDTQLDSPLQSDMPFKALPSIVDRFNKEEAEAVEVEQGDRITTIELNSAPFYAPGSAVLNVEGLKVLDDLLPAITADEYKDYTISIEGYTDDSPIATALFPSNWELSTARAAAVIRHFIDKGVAPQRLRAIGYGEAVPKAPNRDANGNAIPENQAQNRRVVIRMEKIEKAKK
jgi:chemotaxis protein MotB